MAYLFNFHPHKRHSLFESRKPLNVLSHGIVVLRSSNFKPSNRLVAAHRTQNVLKFYERTTKSIGLYYTYIFFMVKLNIKERYRILLIHTDHKHAHIYTQCSP